MKRMIRIGVIFGGQSAEHEVSLISAQSVIKYLDPNRYEVVPIQISRNGTWAIPKDTVRALENKPVADGGTLAPVLSGESSAFAVFPSMDRAPAQLATLDVIFPLVHGPMGEDGTVQGLLELIDVPYVGAGVMASAVGMDKIISKRIFREAGLPVVTYIEVKRGDWIRKPEQILNAIEADIGFPCFVKPSCMGSSVGISKVHQPEELKRAVEHALTYDRKVIVERGIDAREIECSVLGNENPIASIPGEIVPVNEFYDYEAKYLTEGSRLIIPAPLPPDVIEEVQDLAVRAFVAIDCAGMARVDFLLDRHDGTLFVSELNTIPGFTPISMYPKLWEASGIPYPDLLDRLVDLAHERHREKKKLRTTRS